MAEYIEREALINWAKEFYPNDKHFVSGIVNAPTADVVEVVRCKDCLYATERYGHLTCINGISYRNHWNRPDDFCNHGVRMDGDTK